MIIVDSDVLIQLFKKDLTTLAQIEKINEPILIPHTVIAELYRGARDKVELQRISKYFEGA